MAFRRESGKPKTPAPPVDKIETIIGPTARLCGTIQADGSIRIDGIFEGSIETAGNLIIGEQAKILANITAHNVSVAGAIKGDTSANRVEVLETGKIWGDLTVNSFTLDDGGFVSGKVNMHTDMSPPMLEAPKPKNERPFSPVNREPIEGEVVDEES